MAREWQRATALKYASPPRPSRTLGRGDQIREGLRNRGEKVHSGSVSLAGWSDAAFGGQPTEGEFRSGCFIGLMASSFSSPRHISQWTSEFTRKLAKSSLG